MSSNNLVFAKDMKKSPQNSSDETTLWIAFKKGDVRAFEQLYNRYFEVLANYGYRYCTDKQQLEDAIQDVFVDVWRRRQHLADVESVKFYLFRALRHQVIRNTRNDLLETSEDINDFLDLLVSFSPEQQSIEQETHTTQTQAIKKAIKIWTLNHVAKHLAQNKEGSICEDDFCKKKLSSKYQLIWS